MPHVDMQPTQYTLVTASHTKLCTEFNLHAMLLTPCAACRYQTQEASYPSGMLHRKAFSKQLCAPLVCHERLSQGMHARLDTMWVFTMPPDENSFVYAFQLKGKWVFARSWMQLSYKLNCRP